MAELTIPSSDEIVLTPGDIILLTTDGAYEAMDEQHEMFGVDRLLATVIENRSLSSEDFVEALLDAIQSFQAEQIGDIALVVVKVL